MVHRKWIVNFLGRGSLLSSLLSGQPPQVPNFLNKIELFLAGRLKKPQKSGYWVLEKTHRPARTGVEMGDRIRSHAARTRIGD